MKVKLLCLAACLHVRRWSHPVWVHVFMYGGGVTLFGCMSLLLYSGMVMLSSCEVEEWPRLASVSHRVSG